ncbi:uncharacterized protein LOC134231980 [Saccostrea cucullata]|uniref:uncharacterized protein LOC134231980 n=1 Tax=Saccostrea cuccullata TaxID=36930 RepID=UPI002ED55C93
MDAVKLLQKKTTTENNNTSKSLELLPFQKDGLNGFPVIFTPKNCSDVRLPASLFYHRNSDPLLHGQSQVRQEDEFGSCCQIAREKRRQSDKGHYINGSGEQSNSLCVHPAIANIHRKDKNHMCNGGPPGHIKVNGNLPNGNLETEFSTSRNTHSIDDLHEQATETNENGYGYPTDCGDIKTETLSGSDLLLNNSSYLDETEPEVINIDLRPRIVCNGTLISSYHEEDGTSEKQPFLSHQSPSGSESNCSVKQSQSVRWQKTRHKVPDDFVDQTVSLPSSLERHSHVIHETSVTDSESSLSVKPCNIWNKGRPLSGFSSRSISPQPGPSGYNDAKHKRDSGKKTVRYSDTIGSYHTVASGGSSNSINNFPTTLSEEHMNRLDREIRELERVGKKADRGTIYCACGVLGLVIGLILVFVYLL